MGGRRCHRFMNGRGIESAVAVLTIHATHFYSEEDIMSAKCEIVSKFFEEARTNASLRAALAKTRSEDDALEVARRFGYDFTGADVKAAREQKHGPMSDDAAGNIVGGAVGYSADPMNYWGTSQWDEYWSGYDQYELGRG